MGKSTGKGGAQVIASFAGGRSAVTDCHQLPCNRVTFVTVHNAYSREGSPPDARGFDEYFGGLYKLGVRGIELDFIGAEDEWAWSVGHSGSYSSHPLIQLGVYLRALWAWSIKHEPHDPIEIHLDPKDNLRDGFPERFDEYLAGNFDVDRIMRPSDVTGPAMGDLDEASRAGRWPTVGALQDRFLLCLSGHGLIAARYATARTTTPGRLCFADRRIMAAPFDPMLPRDPNRVVVNLEASHAWWIEVLESLKGSDWIVSRTFNVDNDQTLKAALEGGAWAIATNSVNRLTTLLDHRPFIPRAVSDVSATTSSR